MELLDINRMQLLKSLGFVFSSAGGAISVVAMHVQRTLAT